MEFCRIPTDRQRWTVVGKSGWFAYGCLNALDCGKPFRNRVEVGEPGLPFSFVIALHPSLARREHADRFFAADLVVAAGTVVWRTGLPSRHEKVFPAQQQPGEFRSADALPAAIRHDG